MRKKIAAAIFAIAGTIVFYFAQIHPSNRKHHEQNSWFVLELNESLLRGDVFTIAAALFVVAFYLASRK